MRRETVTTTTSSGIGLGGITFIVLLVLKLTEQIAMSWFWVITSFIWVPALGVLAALIVIGLIILVIGAIAVVSTLFRG